LWQSIRKQRRKRAIAAEGEECSALPKTYGKKKTELAYDTDQIPVVSDNPPSCFIFKLSGVLLKNILLQVVLQEEDAAYMPLSLACSRFRDIVGDDNFKNQAHFLWLESYAGKGKRGELQGIFSETFYSGFCSFHCMQISSNELI